ncbi:MULTISPECIES: type II toxin-antitoxin system CcdA family antitoxin [Comamonadaceae]|uniref:type II toxin-antitoxin system CcdA family antitoxin n=1 Tax=Comamonadaceae TaxID=80864 RepID=UPI0027256504|nr:MULTISPECIES: type II toxin-antitoxin system CcdA family antitoxin [Comamonadaceae]MDO9143470.1 type II toxin-antitoxin system CcdA family antitoxin [Rhodoferax sp.]MDP3884953.1 type II toxin-antitoxin system CcdA family antitoxin [Hydrogenophaga sp.]
MSAIQTTAAKRSVRVRQPLKRATNLSLSADVLDAAKALELNISQVCDSYLRELVAQEQRHRWRSEHADFIAAYNATIGTEGLPLDQWRTF